MRKVVSMILALCLVLGTFSLPATAAERDMSRFAAEQTDAGNGEDLSGTEEAGDSDPAETGEEDEAVPEETEDEGLFSSGYAYVAAGTAGYKAANSGERAGAFTARSAVYASLSSRESEADRDWFRVAFYTRDGIAAGEGYETVYVRRAALTAMSEREIAALGAVFDPMLHDAKAQTPGGKPGTIAEVYKRGFMMNGKVLRHAEVRVYRTE